MLPNVIVITGPTATGKTALGARLALQLGGEVVSADSMQIYKYMDIGTAKPSADETLGVPHHMIDVVSPFDSYSAARYVEEASACCDDIIARGKTPVIVGGTGLYIESLLAGRDFAMRDDENVRNRLWSEYDELGGDALLAKLNTVDPETAKRLYPNDKKRIVRALEIYEVTGITMSEHDRRSRAIPPRYNAAKIALSFNDRDVLYARINHRVDVMMAAGLFEEVRSLMDMGLTQGHTALQAIGYKELVSALNGHCTTEESVDKIKQESRRYAKRQLSWLRRDATLKWILWDNSPNIEEGHAVSTAFLEKIGYNNVVDRQK